MIADLLPVALAVTLSPVPIIAVVLILATPRARLNGPAFAVGWVAGLLAASVVVLAIAGDAAADPDSGTAAATDWARVAVGAAFWLLALKTWRGRPAPGETAELPGWMSTIATAGPARALALGLGVSAANPKNLALTATAAAAIAQAGLDGADEAIAVGAFVAIGSISVVGSVGLYLADADRAAAPLASIQRFMTDNNTAITMVILILLGATVLGTGIAGLQG